MEIDKQFWTHVCIFGMGAASHSNFATKILAVVLFANITYDNKLPAKQTLTTLILGFLCGISLFTMFGVYGEKYDVMIPFQF